MIIPAVGILVIATIVATIVTMTGILYFCNWALYKLVMLAFGLKIEPFKDDHAFHTLPTHNGETLSIRDNNQS